MKKVILSLTIILWSIIVMGQHKINYKISGDITTIKNIEKVYLVVATRMSVQNDYLPIVLDSAIVNDGHFLLKGTADEPRLASIKLHRHGAVDLPGMVEIKNNYRFFLAPADIKLKATDSVLSHSVLTGSVYHDQYKELMDLTARYNKTLRPLNEALQNAQQKTDTIKMRAIVSELKIVYDDEQSALRIFVKKYATSPVAVLAVGYSKNPSALTAYFSPKLSQSLVGKEFLKNLNGSKPILKTGDLVPDFILPDTLGRLVKRSSLAGKYVLIDFWASWCGPCRAEIPYLKKVFQNVNTSNFQILCISMDTEKKSWIKAIQDDGTGSWLHLSDIQATKGEIAIKYNVKSIPHNFLIGPDGKLISENIHGIELLDKLKEVLNLTAKR